MDSSRWHFKSSQTQSQHPRWSLPASRSPCPLTRPQNRSIRPSRNQSLQRSSISKRTTTTPLQGRPPWLRPSIPAGDFEKIGQLLVSVSRRDCSAWCYRKLRQVSCWRRGRNCRNWWVQVWQKKVPCKSDAHTAWLLAPNPPLTRTPASMTQRGKRVEGEIEEKKGGWKDSCLAYWNPYFLIKILGEWIRDVSQYSKLRLILVQKG